MINYCWNKNQMKLQERVVLHCDANNFYASVEAVQSPNLKGKAVAVSGNPKKRTGIILAKNEIAKKFGVKTGEAIWQAKQKCPDLICVFPNFPLYESYSMKLRKIYSDYTDQIEPFGIDECWLDVTSSLRLFGSGEKIAHQIREQVKNELGITVSVGVSFCKLFAKLASDMKKPDAVTMIDRSNFKQKIYPLPITDIIGIGKRLEVRLHKLNIYNLGDLANADSEVLKRKFGIIGIELKEKLMGFDFDEVKKVSQPVKSVGNGTTTIIDIETEEEVSRTIMFLCEKVASRLRKKNLLASGVGISLKTAQFKTFHHDKKLEIYTNRSDVLFDECIKLLKSFWSFDTSLRSIRIRSFGLIDANSHIQDTIFNQTKKSGLGYGIDYLKNKYGESSIVIASTLSSNFISTDEKLN